MGFRKLWSFERVLVFLVSVPFFALPGVALARSEGILPESVLDWTRELPGTPDFPSAPLRLESVTNWLIPNHPSLQAGRFSVNSAAGEARSRLGAFDLNWKVDYFTELEGYYDGELVDTVLSKPTGIWGLELLGGYRRSEGRFPIYEGKAITGERGEARIGFGLPLLRGGPTDPARANLRRAELGLEISKNQYTETQIQMLRQSRLGYWEWVAAGRKLRAQRHLLRLAEARDTWLERMVKSGEIARYEREDNRRIVLERRAMVVASERELKVKALHLSLLYRTEDGKPTEPAESEVPAEGQIGLPAMSTLDLDTAVRMAIERRPEISRNALLQDQVRIRRDLENNQLLPKLDIRAHASRDFGRVDPTRRPDEVEARIALEIPLQRRAASGAIASADADRARIAVQDQLLRERASTEVQDALNYLTTSLQRNTYLQEELELARVLEQGEWRRFRQGESHMMTVVLREQMTLATLIRAIEAHADCHRADTELDAALGEFSIN